MKTNEMFGNRPVFSAEVFPPKKSGTLEDVIRTLRDIKPLGPDFVSITFRAGGTAETTADVASIAKDAFGMETVAHMTAVDTTAESLESRLETLKRKGIENILVLRGDVNENSAFYEFRHADELALYIKKRYPEFNLLGACYPEKHPEARSLNEDIDNLKRKVDCGVSELVTQLFFDNAAFFSFREKLAKARIFLPLEAGIMPIVSRSTAAKTVQLSNAAIPERLRKIVADPDDAALKEAGLAFAIDQIDELIENGVDGIHLYTMNRADVAERIFRRFEDARK